MGRRELGQNTIWIDHGVLFNRQASGSVMDLGQAQLLTTALSELAQGRPAPVVFISEGIAHSDAAARRHMASPEVTGLFTALAMVIHQTPMRVIATFFLRFAQPGYPARIFNDIDAATQWAKGYVQD